MASPYRQLKERAWVANQEIPKRGLAVHTFCNASALDAARGVVRHQNAESGFGALPARTRHRDVPPWRRSNHEA